MRDIFFLARSTSKMRTNKSLIGISGIALSLMLIVVFIASCSKDIVKVHPGATPPDVVASTIPADLADTVVIDQILIVNFKKGTISSDISTSKITLKQGTTLLEGTMSYTATSASFDPDNDLMPYTHYTARVVTSFKDDATREDNVNEWSFKTGKNRRFTIPTIVSVIPLLKATSVPVSIQPSVTFNEEMNASTINSTTFTLFQGTTPVAGTISYSGNTATFKPTSSLATNTEYIGTITGGVKNVNGTPLEYGYSWSFTTAAPVDATPPSVLSSVPANNATGVAVSAKPAVTFSEAMNAATINSTTFTLKQGAATVAGSVALSGNTATFTPSSALVESTVYTGTITIGATDAAGNALAGAYNFSFTTAAPVDATPPSVLSSVPANNATGVAVSAKPAVTFSEAMNAATINSTTFTLKQGAATVAGSVALSGNTATFTPSSALVESTVYTGTITIGATDAAGNALSGAYNFSFTTAAPVDATPPSVLSSVPANNATGVAVSAKPAVTFSEAMNAATINSTTFTLKQGAATVAGSVALSGNTATFTPSSALVESTVYTGTITIGATDAAGNALSGAYTWSFTTAAPVDATPPSVLSSVPANNASGVAVSAKPAVTFSEAMNAATINSTTFTLKQGAATVAGAVALSGNTATFTPSSAFTASTVYTGTITIGATDAAGNALSGAYTWSFTTAAPVDATPPSVLSSVPANNATGVAVSAKPAVTFSEVMNSATINSTTFTLKQGAATVAGSVALSGNTATFTPSSALVESTVYTGTITIGATDAAGNALSGAYNFSFTTAAPVDATPPSVLSSVPANNATGVAVSAKPAVTFSEVMNAATINSTTFTLKQGAATVAGSVALSGNTATFTPSSALVESTVYTGTITIGATDAAGNALSGAYNFSFTTAAPVDATPPSVLSSVPANNASGVAVSAKPAVTFSEAMNAATINSTTFTLKQGAATVAGAVALSGNTATFTPSSAFTASTVYTGTITIGATDAAGNALSGAYTWSFTTAAPVDATPPSVLSSVPANNATGVAVSAKPAVTFSEVMNAATINSTTFTLKQGAATVAGSVALSGNTATFTPSSALVESTVYTGTITIGATDAAGNAIANNYTWSFTTADVTPPTVSSVTPANSATGIATNSTVRATFSEAMTSSTITTTTFTLKQGTTAVAGTVTYSGSTATFTPSAALAGGVVYTATITTGAKDAAGNAIASNYSWSFTTAPAVVLVSFSSQVFPIVLDKCAGCHDASTPSAGIPLTNYTQVKAVGSKLVVSSMISLGGVTTAERTILQTWLDQGSLNN